MIIAFWLLNHFTPYIIDDLGYSFIMGTNDRLSSFPDIFVSLSRHYTDWGGRLVAHFFTMFFLYIGDKNVFDICNTIVYGIFILLVCFHITGSFKKITGLLYGAVNIILWFLVPEWGQNFLWQTGSCNYLWTTTLILLFLIPFRKKNDDPSYKLNFPLSVLFLFLGVLAGWTNENSGAAILCLLIAYFGMKVIDRQKVALFEVLGALGFLIGFCLLVCAPGNYVRVEMSLEEANNQRSFLVRLFMQFWTATEMFFVNGGFLMAGLTVILGYDFIVRQKQKLNLFTWYYLFAGITGVYCMIMSPEFPGRAYLIVTVFLCIALLSSLRQVEITVPEIVKRNIPAISTGIFIIFGWSFLMASRNIAGIYTKTQSRIAYIQEQKSKGILDVEVPAPIPASDKHAGPHYIGDIHSDSNFPLNKTLSRYYEIHSIKGVEK
jgi:hypothetical protein